MKPTMYKPLRFEMKSHPETSDTADVYIYDYVGDSWSDTEDNVSTAAAFRKVLDDAGSIKKLNLHVNSCGGACDDGVAIYSMLQQHPAEKTAYVEGYACSIASLIVAACDKIVMSKPSMMMIHNALAVEYGNAKKFRAKAEALDKATSGIKAAYLDKAGDKLTKEKLDKLMDGKDGDGTWLTAAECLEYGLCDEVLSKSASEGEPEPTPTPAPEPVPQDKTKIVNTFRAFLL